MRIYMSGKLTGRSKEDIEAEHKPIRKSIVTNGWEYHDPFEKESDLLRKKQRCTFDSIKMSIAPIVSLDKKMIRESDVLLVLTGDLSSKGTYLEIGYARYHVVMPVIAIAPDHVSGKQKSWLTVEADFIASTYEGALDYIEEYFATPEQRLIWKCKILSRHGRENNVEEELTKHFRGKNEA